MAKPVDVRNIEDLAAGLALELGTSLSQAEVEAAVTAALASNPNLSQAEVEAAFTAALAASQPIDVNIVGGSSVPFQTGEEAIPAPPAITQLPTQATPKGAILRADEDLYIYSTSGGTNGFLVYEGDDIRMTTISNLDQVYVKPAKNKAITLWWMTI